MKLEDIWQQAKQLWGKLSKVQRVALVAVVALALGASAFFALYEPPVEYTTIASNLSDSEAAAIVEQLDADKIPYELVRGDETVRVKVPNAQADKVRLSIASRGLESGGFGFKEYIAAPYTVSAQREQKLHTIALGREIARIIGTLDAVRKAEVVLTLPKKSVFREGADQPRASSVVYLRRGRELSRDEVRGIVNLIANGVDGLMPSAVSLMDGRGTPLWAGGADNQVSTAKDATEAGVQHKIEALLQKVLGPGGHHVTVTATYDRSEMREEREIVEVDEKTSEISRQVVEETRGPAVVRMGPAGARGNTPNPPVSTGTATTEGPRRRSETANYRPSVISIQKVETHPRLVRLDVSVAIDEPAPVVTSSVATSSTGVMLARGEVDLGPARKLPDIAQLAGLIRAAAGLDMEGRKDTLEIRTMPMYHAPVAVEEPAPAPPLPWHQTLPEWAYMAVAGAAAFMMLVILVSIRRRNRARAEEEAELLAGPTRADELEAVLEGADYEPEPTLTELRDKVHQQVEMNEDLAAEILLAWINDKRGDEDLEEAA